MGWDVHLVGDFQYLRVELVLPEIHLWQGDFQAALIGIAIGQQTTCRAGACVYHALRNQPPSQVVVRILCSKKFGYGWCIQPGWGFPDGWESVPNLGADWSWFAIPLRAEHIDIPASGGWGCRYAAFYHTHLCLEN